MKNKVVRSIAFSLGLIILLITVSALLKRGSDVDNTYAVRKKIRDVKEEQDNSINVVFLGDSESYSAFNPLQMYKDEGFTSYVCATSLQKLCDSYALLKKTYEVQSPKVVVLETNCLFRRASNNDEELERGMKMLSSVLPILRYHNRWKSALTLERLYRTDDRNSKGFKYRTQIKSYTGGEWMNYTDARETIEEGTKNYFTRVKDLVERKGAKLVLMSVPSPDNWSYEKHNAVQDLADEEDISYVDMNLMWKQLQIDWDVDSKDGGDHLNFTGAKKVSGYVGGFLKTQFDLPDNRGDIRYEGWQRNIEVSQMEL